MKYLHYIPLICLAGCAMQPDFASEQAEEEVLHWNSFSPTIFEEADAKNKLVLLHVGAQWCHWCHVMEDSTYADPEVQLYLNDHFVLAKEDQDSRPDLFTKYRSFGWPAIILFDAEANELVKLRGYQERTGFLALLKNTVKNPVILAENAEPVSTNTYHRDSLTTSQLMALFESRIDFEKGSLNTYKKSLFAPSVEMALNLYPQSDSLKNWLQLSIENSYQLMDTVWGGVFQYATHSDWKNAHYERLLRVQAEHIIHYTRYAALFEDEKAIERAERIYDYCNNFLSQQPPLFNNSQDADYKKGIESTSYYKLTDAERRKLGVPVTHPVQFLKENALMCKALVYLWAVTGNEKYLTRAEKMLTVLRTDFKNTNGLYQRSKTDSVIFSLDDNVAMLDALITANQVTGQVLFLNEAEELAGNIMATFTNKYGTLNSVSGDLTLDADVLGSSNLNAAFLLVHLGTLLHNDTLQNKAHQLADALLRSSNDYSDYFIAYRLLEKKYLQEEPVHAVLIFDEPGTSLEKEMLRELIALGNPNLVIERVGKNKTEEQELLYGDVKSGTLFLCNSSFCSSPITSADAIREALYPENKKTMLPQQHGFSNSVLQQ